MSTYNSFQGSTANRYITPLIEVYSNPDTAGNYSDVNVFFYYKKSSSSTASTYGTWSGGITIDGERTSAVTRVTLPPNNSWISVMTASKRVYHEANGKKSIYVSADGSISGTTLTSTSCGGTVTLDTIPRASGFSVGNGTLGSASAISVSKADGSFTHTITCTPANGGAAQTICTKSAATSLSFTPPLAWASSTTAATTFQATYTLQTYSGSTAIGSAVTKTVTMTIPASVKPSITGVSVVDSTNYSEWYGGYIQGYSKPRFTITAATSYGSAIKSCSTTFAGGTYSGSNFTTGAVNAKGELRYTTTVTDARGRTASRTGTVKFLGYSAPSLSGVKLYRADAYGGPASDGIYLYAAATAVVTALKGSKTNTGTMTVTYTGGGIHQLASGVGINIAAGLDITRSYAATIRLTDTLGNSTTYSTTIPTDSVTLSLRDGGKGARFGGYAESDGLLQVDWDLHVNGTVSSGSDRRLKEDIRDIPEELVDAFLELTPRAYTMIASGKECAGFIAQEVEGTPLERLLVMRRSRDGLLSLDYTSLHALSLAAVQRIYRRLTDLEGGGNKIRGK